MKSLCLFAACHFFCHEMNISVDVYWFNIYIWMHASQSTLSCGGKRGINLIEGTAEDQVKVMRNKTNEENKDVSFFSQY